MSSGFLGGSKRLGGFALDKYLDCVPFGQTVVLVDSCWQGSWVASGGYLVEDNFCEDNLLGAEKSLECLVTKCYRFQVHFLLQTLLNAFKPNDSKSSALKIARALSNSSLGFAPIMNRKKTSSSLGKACVLQLPLPRASGVKLMGK